MDHKSREKAVRGVAWTTGANWGSQLLNFCFYTALARLLNPHAFGLVALAWVYIAFIQIFVTQGFGMAIIQRPDLEEEHLDSAFWIALATAGLFCLATILFAGLIGRLFKEPQIAPVIKWLCFSMLFNALCSVHNAILTRDLNFGPLALRSLVSTGVGGVVGVTMAYLGYGVWSLVGQQLLSAALGCVFLWCAIPWRPQRKVSKRHLHDLYAFSLSITGNDMLWFFSQRSDQTMVGYGSGAMALGSYSLAGRLTSLAYEALVAPMQSVAFPAFAKLQSDPQAFERAVLRFCELSSFLCLPIFMGLALTAPDVIPLLLGSKWLPAIPILQVLAFYGAARVLLAFMHPLMLAKGRAGLYLIMNVVLSVMTVAGCTATFHHGPHAIAQSMVITLFVFLALFLMVADRQLQISTAHVMRAFSFPVLCSGLMFTVMGLVRSHLLTDVSRVSSLFITVAAGMLLYVGVAFLLRPSLPRAILMMARSSLMPGGSSRSLEPLTVGLGAPSGLDQSVAPEAELYH